MLMLCVLDEGSTIEVDEKGGQAGTNSRCPTESHMFLSFPVVSFFCRLYKSPLSDQAQVILQLTVGLSDLV